MKRITLTFVFLCALGAFAFGGGQPLPDTGKEMAPPPPLPDASCFEGWYFGLHVGGLIGESGTRTFVEEESLGAQGNGFVFAFDSSREDAESAFQGGLHFGRNWQRGGWIFGFEADLSATHVRQSDFATAATELPNGPLYITGVESQSEIDWYSTLRPRFGHTLGDRVFLYGTGGLALSNARTHSTSVLTASTSEGGSTFAGESSTDDDIKFGWTAGAGIEFCLSHNLILSFTYLYVDLANSSVTTEFNETSGQVDQGVRTYDAITHTSTGNNFHVVQGGLSIKF